MGTPEIASQVLEKLILCGYNIVGVVSQPDRPVGRKKLLLPTPTKEVALKYNTYLRKSQANPKKSRRNPHSVGPRHAMREPLFCIAG